MITGLVKVYLRKFSLTLLSRGLYKIAVEALSESIYLENKYIKKKQAL